MAGSEVLNLGRSIGRELRTETHCAPPHTRQRRQRISFLAVCADAALTERRDPSEHPPAEHPREIATVLAVRWSGEPVL
jgi:hypothetical protein